MAFQSQFKTRLRMLGRNSSMSFHFIFRTTLIAVSAYILNTQPNHMKDNSLYYTYKIHSKNRRHHRMLRVGILKTDRGVWVFL